MLYYWISMISLCFSLLYLRSHFVPKIIWITDIYKFSSMMDHQRGWLLVKSDLESRICKKTRLWDLVNRRLNIWTKPSPLRSNMHVNFGAESFFSMGSIYTMSIGPIGTKVLVWSSQCLWGGGGEFTSNWSGGIPCILIDCRGNDQPL